MLTVPRARRAHTVVRPSRGRLLARGLSLAAAVSLTVVLPATAQFQEARRPARGEVWFRFTPRLINWSERFALDSPDPFIADGDREPLHADFDGPLADRLFAGAQIYVDDLNTLSGALGFEPITEAEFSLGSLEFGTINAQRRELELGLEYGLTSFLSFEIGAPLVFTEVEPFFQYDPTGATAIPATSAFPAGDPFFGGFQSELDQLSALINGGTLMGAELQAAMDLFANGEAFLSALQARAMMGGLIPAAGSRAGMEVVSYFGGLQAGFEGFGFSLPDFTLPDAPDGSDLNGFFTDLPLGAQPLAVSERGFAFSHFEAGVRIGLLDGIGEGRPLGPYSEPADSAGPSSGSRDARSWLRLRTSVGAKVRFVVGRPEALPFRDPSDFLGLPIGDGQRDIEIAGYQDVAAGDRWYLTASARYGIQLADRIATRLSAPDRPLGFAATETVVERDLGDYLSVRVAPRFWLTTGLGLGIELEHWSKQSDRYTLIPDEQGELPAIDPSPLELETRETRRRIGFGLYYDTGRALRQHEMEGAPVTPRRGWRFAFTARRAFSGSGGRTPASALVSAHVEIPITLVP